MTIEKCIIDIKLANCLSTTNTKIQDYANSDRVNNWTKCLMKVNLGSLVKTFSNKAGLVAVNGTIGMLLIVKNPFISHKIVLWIRWHNSPCVVAE